MPELVPESFSPEILLALEAGGPNLVGNLMLPVALVAIFYFLIYRPQKQEADALAKLIAGLQKGDQVVTTSGIHAKIHEAKGDTLVLEVAQNSYLTVDRDAIKRKKEVA